jgi:ABC-type maltose transport system permease subunit
MAAAILAVIPVAIVFVLFQRYIIEGISTSGLKE